jgi:hypothetical protein
MTFSKWVPPTVTPRGISFFFIMSSDRGINEEGLVPKVKNTFPSKWVPPTVAPRGISFFFIMSSDRGINEEGLVPKVQKHLPELVIKNGFSKIRFHQCPLHKEGGTCIERSRMRPWFMCLFLYNDLRPGQLGMAITLHSLHPKLTSAHCFLTSIFMLC